MYEIYGHNNDIFIASVSLAKQQCSDVLVGVNVEPLFKIKFILYAKNTSYEKVWLSMVGVAI